MHKKKSLAEADPFLFLNNYSHRHAHTHTHPHTGISLVAIKSTFAWQLTIEVLSSSDWTSARSPGHLQNTACPQLIWGWMAGYVWVCVCEWRSFYGRGRGRVERFWVRGGARGGGVQSQPTAGRGLQTTTAALILTAPNKKGSPPVLVAPGPPRVIGGGVGISSCPMGPDLRPKPPGLTALHLRPTFSDDALKDGGWKTVRWQWSQAIQNDEKPRKQKRDRVELWSSAGNAGAVVCGHVRRSHVLRWHSPATTLCISLVRRKDKPVPTAPVSSCVLPRGILGWRRAY